MPNDQLTQKFARCDKTQSEKCALLPRLPRQATSFPKEKISLPLPVCANDIRRYKEGTNAIVNVVPTPTVYKHVETDSAYVLLHEVLSLYLPYGLLKASKTPDAIHLELQSKNNTGETSTFWQTHQATKLLYENENSGSGRTGCEATTEKLLICLWSDGCDPNARNKTNRGSMHITTASILCRDNRNDPNNTFVLAMGREGADHSKVRELIYSDIKKLESTHKFFDGSKLVDVQVLLFCHLADRPERSETTGFGSHMGKLTQRWGHVSVIPIELPSCQHCFANRMNCISTSLCTDQACLDWNFDDIHITVDKEFPEEFIEINGGKIRSSHFSFQNAFDACQLSSSKLLGGEWGVQKSRSFLLHQGVNNKVIDKIIENASSDDPKSVENICPPIWKPKLNYTLNSYVPAIMHLCFLGVTSTVGSVLRDTFVNFGKFTKFREHDVMKPLRNFSLSWCRAWTYGSNKTPYGPWTGENYLAYSRIFKCVYSVSTSLLTENQQDYERLRVANLLRRTAASLNAMLSRIMQPAVTDILVEDTDRHIKLFLSLITELDDFNTENFIRKQANSTRKGKRIIKKRKINSTSNLTSLLNLPQFMKEFGPPRLYWEGGFKGEGILRSVKPVVTQGTHMSWFATAAMQKFYYDKSMHMLLENSCADPEDQMMNYTNRNIFTYRNGYSHIESEIQKGRPISAALCSVTGETYCATIVDKQKCLSRLIFDDDHGIYIGNTFHTPISVSASETRFDVPTWNDFTFVLLLPNRRIEGNPILQHYYYCITEHWLERRRRMNNEIIFTLPQIDGAKYIDNT